MPWKPSYVTDARLKAYLRIEDAEDDAEIALAVEAASRAIDHSTGRQFGQVAAPEARLYEVALVSPGPAYESFVSIDDLMDTTGMTAHYSNSYTDPVYDQAITDLTLWPWNAPAEGKPFTRLVALSGFPLGRNRIVQVTARWGWDAVPTAIEEATLIQAARFFMRRSAPFGVAGSPEAGSELRLLERLDPDVAVLVQAYRRHWGAV